MIKLLKRFGWWRTDDGRWFRHCNDDGSQKRGITSIETAWGFGSFGPYLGLTLTKNDGYSDNSKLYIALVFWRVWLGFGKSNHRNEQCWGVEANRSVFDFYWGCEERYGNWKNGPYFRFPWFKVKDFIFGRQIFITERPRDYDIKKGFIEMPEGKYPALFSFETRVWFRSRSPFRKMRYDTWVEIPIGIPESGKGENSWDCGEDALYGTGISGKTKAEGHDIGRAAAHVRECSLRTRAKRGDPECWPMSPEDRAIQLEKQRAERAAQEK